MSYRGVATIFLELVAAVEWFELPEAEDRTAEKAAKMAVNVGIIALWLDFVEDPRIVVARSLSEIGSALWRRCS
jgi:hypothetical protein